MNIAKSLEKYLILSNEYEDKGHLGKKYYLSDSGKCERVRFLKRKGVKTEFEPHVYWILQMGTLLHDYGYKALESQGILLQSEDEIETEHFKGRYDGLVKHNKEKCIFDFKSAGKWKFSKVVDGVDDEDNYGQLLSYIMLLQDEGKDISDTGFLVYMNKEPSDDMPIPFFQKEYHLTNQRRDLLRAEMDKMVEYWLKDKIPACTCPAWMKNYNAYLPLCQMKEEGIKKVLEYIEAGKKVVTTKTGLYLIDGESRKELKI